MKRIIVIVVVIAILAIGGFFVYQQFLAPVDEPTPTSEIDLSAPSALPEVVSAEGFIVPAMEADLSFQVSGQVVEVLVAEGDSVETGQVLIRLDDSDQQKAVAQSEAGVTQAKAAVTSAQARLTQAQTGPTDEAIAQAEAAVQSAQTRLDQVKAGPTQENIAQAEAALQTARSQLAQVKAGPTDEVIAQAEAALQTAQARLDQLLVGARPEDIQAAAADLLTAQAALRQAQAEYDKIAWAGDVGETPQAIALEQATLSYEAAKARYDRVVNGATAEEIAVAQAGVVEAEAALSAAKAGPTGEAIAVAEAGVAEAEAALATVLAGATDEEIAIAEAGVAEAEAALATVLAGATDEEIAIAEAGVAEAEAGLVSAQAALGIAQAALSDFELTSPLAGTIARLNVEVGELVSPGVAVTSLGDSSIWYVETDDLTEIDVIQVAVGQPAKVTIDALPAQEFNGVVTDIAPRSETKRGDVTYTVTIELSDAADAPLRWGLTAFVDINVE